MMQSDLFGNVPEIVIDIHETGGKGKNAVQVRPQAWCTDQMREDGCGKEVTTD